MVMTPSQMLPLGTPAPPFRLPDSSGNEVGLGDGPPNRAGTLVVFMCNHCPFVVHVRSELAALGRHCAARDVAMFGISSNDIDKYPADAPDKMAEEVAAHGYTFPYLFDETQQVAKAYNAACTPDFYLFDRHGKLVYRGQLDDSRPGNDVPVTGSDLRTALDAVVAGRAPSTDQRPSVGCNIKWKPGNEPAWFG